MATITYYVALSFVRTENGELVVGEAQTASAALSAAASVARTSPGAVAFSRTGDPSSGEFSDAGMIREFGEVSRLDDLFSGG